MSILFSLSSFLIQIFLMCAFGQETITEFNSLSYRLYCSDWPNIIAALNRKNSNNCHVILTMFMENLKYETKVTIGKVFTLALKTFSSVRAVCRYINFTNRYFWHAFIFLQILTVAYRLFAILKWKPEISSNDSNLSGVSVTCN